MCTCECFFLSELLANLRSHPSYSHLNGFSPAKTTTMCVIIIEISVHVADKQDPQSSDQLQCSKAVKRGVQCHDDKFPVIPCTKYWRWIDDGIFGTKRPSKLRLYNTYLYIYTRGLKRGAGKKKGLLETLKILGLKPFLFFVVVLVRVWCGQTLLLEFIRFTCVTRMAHKSYSKWCGNNAQKAFYT